MSESTQRGRVVKGLRSLDAHAVENRVGPGTPDIEFIGGWIEMKQLRRWPKVSPESVILMRHYTVQQRVWAKRRARRGGKVFLLLKIHVDWILLDGAWAADHLGKTATRADLFRNALGVWGAKGLNDKELIQCLQR